MEREMNRISPDVFLAYAVGLIADPERRAAVESIGAEFLEWLALDDDLGPDGTEDQVPSSIERYYSARRRGG